MSATAGGKRRRRICSGGDKIFENKRRGRRIFSLTFSGKPGIIKA